MTGDVWKGVFASVLLHVAAAAAVLFTMTVAPPARTPLVVDLTLEGPETPAATRPIPAPAIPVAPSAPTPLSVPPVKPAPAPAAQPLAASPTETPAPGVAGAGSPERSPSAAGAPDASGGSATVPVAAPSGATAYRAGTGSGETGEPRANAAGRYGSRNFAYIRDAIQRGIAYPAMARRMGWEGKVVVSFLVLSDGSVRDVRVVQGSGYPALDRGAVDAVRKASPFPRPPAEAEIITPVVYRLE